MLYGIIRFFIVLLLFTITFFIIKKLKITHKNLLSSLSVVTILILGLLLYNIPFENLFIKFSTPDEVFYYTSTGEIKDIVYGKNSCMIIYKYNNSIRTSFTSKDNGSYKIVTQSQLSTDSFLSKDGVAIDIITLNKVNESYSFGTIYSHNNSIKLSDNSNSNYKLISTDSNEFYRFYSYLNDYNNTYYLYLNSEKINFRKTG